MRLKALVLSLAAYLLMTIAAHAAVVVPTPLVYLEASGLPLGDVLVWYNQGSQGGQFQSLGAPPQVEMVSGRRAVSFSGNNGFRSVLPLYVDNRITASNPWSVSVNILNQAPNKYNEMDYLVFGRDNGAAAQWAEFGYGFNVQYGAVRHDGVDDMGWDRGTPAQGVWHNLTYTYSGIGGWERVYVDGVLNAIENKFTLLDIPDVQSPYLLGTVDGNDGQSRNFKGSISSLRIWSGELNYEQVDAVSGWDQANQKIVPIVQPMCPTLVNGSFELPHQWSQNAATNDSRNIPGWCSTESTNITNMNRIGIGIAGPNLNLNTAGSNWDNGVNTDGLRVMALSGTATAAQGISQYVYLYTGKTYRLHFAYNAKTTGTPTMTVRVNGNAIGGTPITVVPVDGTGSFTIGFYTFDADFTIQPGDFAVNAPGGFYAIEIEESDIGVNNCLLLDDARVMMYGNPNPLRIDQYDQGGLDFGLVAKNSQTDTSLTVHNLSGVAMNFGNNYGVVTANLPYQIVGTDAANFQWFNTDPLVNAVYGTANNATINPFADDIIASIRFKPGNAMKVYTATLNLTWSNATFAGTLAIPLKGTVAAYPQFLNGSFEQPKNADWNGWPASIQNNASLCPYAYYDFLGDQVKIPNWLFQGADGFWYNSPQSGIGVEDHVNRNTFCNNGSQPDLRQGLYIQTLGDNPGTNPDGTSSAPAFTAYNAPTRTIRQYLGGFVTGRTYKISMWVSARNAGTSRASFSMKMDDLLLTMTNPGVNAVAAAANGNLFLGYTDTAGTGGIGGYLGVVPVIPAAYPNQCTSATIAQAGGYVKVEANYKATREGPIPFDIVAYTRRDKQLATGKWQWDSSLDVDKVQIFDMSLTNPACNPMVYTYDTDLNYMQGAIFNTSRAFWSNRNYYPLNMVSGVGYQVGGFPIVCFNEGYGAMNVSNFRYEGINGKHWAALPANITGIRPYGNYMAANVYFKPKAGGYYTDAMLFDCNDTTGTYRVPLKGLSFGGPVIQNGSFELPPVLWGPDVSADPAVTVPSYAYLWRELGTNILPPYWWGTANTGNAGVSVAMNTNWTNNAQTAFHVNNGLITQGNQVLWMQATTPAQNIGNRSARQVIYGWQAGTQYHFRVWVNCRAINDNKANFQLRITLPTAYTVVSTLVNCDENSGGTALTALEAVNSFTIPYTMYEADWVAPATQYYAVELYTPFNDDDSTVLVDAVDVTAVVNGVKHWSLFD